MSEIKRSKTYVRFHVKVAMTDFSHFEAYNKGPPMGPRMSIYKVLHCQFRALVRLLSRFSVDLQYVCCARGGVGIGAVNALVADPPKREFGGTSTNVLSANYTCQVSSIWRLAQLVGDSTSVRCGRVLKVLGVKRWQAVKA